MTHIKCDVIISSSLRLLLKVWIWYRYQSRTENYYQSPWWWTIRFLQRSTCENSEQKEGCSCNLLLINETKNKKRRILIYLTKAVSKRTSNAIFSMKKVNLDES